jgi:hypothetical protein
MPRAFLLTFVLCGLTLIAAIPRAAGRASPVSVDEAFRKFWDARNPDEAARAADDVVRSRVTFEDARARLKKGRAYSSSVKRGVVHLDRRSIAGDFFYDLNVPDTYDPARAYQVRVQLHGGVMMRETGEPRAARGVRGGGTGRGGSGPLLGAEQIYVMPTAWRDAPWWSRAQLENLAAILDSVKRTYNVDENHVALAGVSDGATAAFYVSMRETTPFSSFLPLNGFLMVLANGRLDVDGDLFPTNLLNKPLFVVNGGQDPLYPIRAVQPYVEHLKRSGVDLEYHPQPASGHDTSWWPEVRDSFEAFVRGHPRDPLPARLTWEAADRQTPSRAHWLVIDRVAPTAAPKLAPDLNVFSGEGPNRGRELFGHQRPSGRVDLVRAGNTVRLTTRGVAGLTLLLSPDAFDFSKRVVVIANGGTVADNVVEPSVATLMKWAARDDDRTMLFGAELHVGLK